MVAGGAVRRVGVFVVLGCLGVGGLLSLLDATSAVRLVAGPYPATTSAVSRAGYVGLPVGFEPNRGQAPRQYRYVAGGAGYAIGLGRGEVTLSLLTGAHRALPLSILVPGGHLGLPVASGKLPGRVNYLVGSDPRSWLRDVRTFAGVRYERVWPGIDLAFHGRHGVLEYDFDLAPGAQADRVALRFAGARALRSDGHGGALLAVGGSTLRIPAPQAMQDDRPVSSRLMVNHGTMGLALGAYDRARPLTVDPFIVYSTYLGGSRDDAADTVAVGKHGDVYVSGATASRDFPTTPRAWRRKLNGPEPQFCCNDTFLSRMNASLSALVYSTYGPGGKFGGVDSGGNAYFLDEADRQARGSGKDIVVTKLNSTGSAIVYRTYIGGSGDESAGKLVVDPAGDTYIAGLTDSKDFPVTRGAPQRAYAGGLTDAFVAKLNPTGSRLLYSTYLGSTDIEGGRDELLPSVAIDAGRHAYLMVQLQGNIPTTPHAYRPRYQGHLEIFVAKLNRNGTRWIYATYLGKGIFAGQRGPSDIEVDRHEAAYVLSGNFYPSRDESDQWLTKLNPAGRAVVYIRDFTHLPAAVVGVAADCAGRATFIGGAQPDLPTTPDAYQHRAHSSRMIIGRLKANGKIDYLSYLPGTGEQRPAIDRTGAIYIAGDTDSNDPPFPATRGAFQTVDKGRLDNAFVAKLSLPRPAACPRRRRPATTHHARP